MRDFEVVVFGATGFTGRLVAEYLAGHGPEDLRWAVAGRSLDKLAQVADRCPPGRRPAVVRADVQDEESLREMARRAVVVATTVGPYVRFGGPVVRACVEAGTHCLDLTGEPAFVHRVRAELDEPARRRGTRVVNCCGFDSIPADFGAYALAKSFQSAPGPTEMEGILRTRATFSGGTYQSALEAFSKPRELAQLKRKMPLLPRQAARRSKKGLHRHRELGVWAVPLPIIDVDVVCRSAESQPHLYGHPFRYGHFYGVRRFSRVTSLALGVGAFGLGAQLPGVKQWMARWTPAGSGPDPEARNQHWFWLHLRGVRGEEVRGYRVAGGDPGYTETAKMLAEAAVCAAQSETALPDAAGVLTPVQAFGDVLLHRLRRAGLHFEPEEPGAGP